jgi:TrpR-related protein YerC/YecD
MVKTINNIWGLAITRQFAEALMVIDDTKTMQNFLRDVMTESEIIDVSARLEAARMLQDGAKYTEIIKKTKLSSRTVARISEWMNDGCGGYAKVLEGTALHHDHIPPVRVE